MHVKYHPGLFHCCIYDIEKNDIHHSNEMNDLICMEPAK